ncbi:MAG: hypothetical protein J6Z40_11540 [Oscillospiraceae bacterium]|nr:hypothetical protein [Oscillospiraceae bacterium]
MKYDELKLGECVRYADVKDLLGDELTFAQLVREPGTSKLLLWMSATVGGELQDDSEFLVCQIEKVLDFDPEEDTDEGDEEWATVLFDIPGFSSKPVQLEYEDFEAPEIEDGDDPTAMHNMYHRIWRLKKALQPLERLALGAAIYSKCKANYIDSTEELLQAFESGLIRTVFSSPQISQIKTVLHNAHIGVPDIVPAVPDSPERTKLLREDLQRGTGFEDGKQRVSDYVQKNRPNDSEFAEFLKKEYGCGGHSGPKMPDVSYDSKGVHIRTADKARAYNYTWIEAAKELRGMIERGEYLTEKQETALAAAAPAELGDPLATAQALHQRIVNDAQTAAESIWDMAKAIKEMRDGKHYKSLLYANFEGYCEEALGMSRAHAYRYIQIAEGMTAEKVASMRQIGTTKLALLATVTEEQQEIVTTAVDVESATVKELKAEIDKLKGKVEKAEQDAQKAISQRNAEAARSQEFENKYVKADNQNLVLKETIASKDKIISGKNISMDNLRANIEQLQAQITELENRPVEVAVQEDTEALEQLRKEYEKKLEEAAADNEYKEVLAMCRLARQQVDAVCIRLKGIRAGKAKDSLIKYTKEIGLLLGQLN